MIILIGACLGAALVTLLLVHSSSKHAHLSSDHEQSGPQKFHAHPVPRIGGIGIFIGALAGLTILCLVEFAQSWLLLSLMGCALPAFLSGLAEDVTKNVSPRRRLFFTCISALLALIFVDGLVDRSGITYIDSLLALPLVAPLVTILSIAGITNAVNIIDGFNGLASMCVMLILLAICYVAYQVGDKQIYFASLIIFGAVLGFFIFNFPAGLIFLGDGGAYFLGFMVAELAVLLFHRNPSVSPMFALLICIYPTFETLFSIYRKKFIRKMSPGIPDGVHLHMLVYKRLMRWAIGRKDAKALTRRNSFTSPYLWVLCTLSVVPAVLFWNNTPLLVVFILIFSASYVAIYWKIVRFRAPRWLVVRKESASNKK